MSSDNSLDAQEFFKRGDLAWQEAADPDRAIANYTEAIRLNPNYAEAYSKRAWFRWLIKRDYNGAIADFA